MEVGANVWVKNTFYKDPTKDDLWENQQNNKVKVTISNESSPALVLMMDKFATETPEVKLRNPAALSENVENLIDLPGLNEPEMLHALKNRYFKHTTYTYTGSILIAINPFNIIAQNAVSEGILKSYCFNIKNDIIAQSQDGFESTQQISSEIDFATSPTTALSPTAANKTVRDHSILISGESGSGKTECSKLLLKYLSAEGEGPSPKGSKHTSSGISNSSTHHQVVQNIIKATPILEALGHARTVYTYNSSRFAKCLELSINGQGALVGGAIRSYLLETSRITSQLPGERNYHIFYQLLSGASAEELASLHLSGDSSSSNTSTSHRLVNQGNVLVTPATEQQDADDYQVLRAALRELGVEDGLTQSLFRLVAGLLHLGNIEYYEVYDNTGEGGEIVKDSLPALAHCAELCDFDEAALRSALTIRTIGSRTETYTKKLTKAQCISGKDALAKALYKRAFDTIVSEVNRKICVSRADEDEVVSRLSILDIFGFDCFAVNTFEQLCINYANEILQQQFNQQIFKLELLEYNKECISFDSIDFVDNQDTLELINNHIFKVLDDQCKLANATDARFVAMLYTVCAGKKKFTASGKQQRDGVFIIQHFAGPVTYSPEKFIEKNLDELPQDALTLIGTSKNAVLNNNNATKGQLLQTTPSFLEHSSSIRDLNAAPAHHLQHRGLEHTNSVKDMHAATAGHHVNAGFPRKTAAKASAVGQFKSELAVLIKQINATVPHYIRCINPLIRESEAHTRAVSNSSSSSSGVDSALPNTLAARAAAAAGSLQFHQLRVAEQLRSGGVLEAVRVARSGYPFRLDHLDFYARYRLLANPKNEVTSNLPRILSKTHPALSDKETLKRLLEQLLVALLRPPSSPASAKYIKSGHASSAGGNEVAACLSRVCSPLSTSHTVQVGLTKVFMKKADREVLETSLLALRKFAGEKIYSIVYFYHVRTKFQKIMSGARLLQRVVRSAAVRIKLKKEKLAQQEAHEREQVARANAEAMAVQQSAAAAEAQTAAAAVKARQAEEKAARAKREKAEQEEAAAAAAAAAVAAEEQRRAEIEAHQRQQQQQEAEAAALRQRRQESQRLRLDTDNLGDSSSADVQAHQAELEQRHDHMMRTSLALTVNTEYVAAKVAEYKVLDTSLLTEINALISNKKVSDEDSILRFDIERAKKLLRDWMSYLGAETQLYTRVNDIANTLDYGYMLLSSEKLIPMTTLGKAFSFGKKVTAHDRTASAKYANKCVDKEHKMFKPIFKMLERIKECLELAKSDRDEIEQKRRQSQGGAQLHLIDTLLHYITKISDFCKILYTYYYQYILHTVAEFGEGSPFKQSFHDEVAYILALAELIDQRKPMLSSETKPRKENEDNNGFFSVTNTVSKLSRSVATDDKIHFKSIPYAPGVEFAVNCLNILLNGEMLMYPIRFIKLVGKSASNYNQVAYYQASTKLCDATLHTVLREPEYVQCIDIDSFSSSLLTVLLMGAINVQPDNFMLKVYRDVQENTLDHNMSMMSIDNSSISSIVLQGVNNDMIFTSGLFQYQQILEAEDLIDRIGSSSADQDLASRLNILLFLPQMQCPVSPRLRKLLIASNTSVDLLMSNWLRELFLQNRRYDYLKQSGFTNEDLAALKLPIKLPPGVSLQIYSKLKKIKKYLKENPRALNINLLTEIHPTLANYYDALRKQNSEALASYKSNPILANANRNAAQNVNFTTGPQDHTLDNYVMTVEDTALEFMSAMDFSSFTTQDDLICCKMIIDNLSFLPVLYLYRVSEAQLYAMFSNLIDSTMESNRRNIHASMGQSSPVAPPRSQINVKRVVLTGLDEATKMYLLNESRILMAMHSILGFVIYFDNELVESVAGFGPDAPRVLQLSPRSASRGMSSMNLNNNSNNNGASQRSFYRNPSMRDAAPNAENAEPGFAMIDGEIRRKLQYLLNNYSNLTQNKTLAEMSTDILVIKEMVRQACSGMDPEDYDLETVKQYGNILLEFPGLTNITKDLAVKGIFNKIRNILYPMLDHDQLDRYVDIIVSILRSDPALLYVRYNTRRPIRGLAQVYPCDVIKSVPDSKMYKYRVLAALINMASFSNVVFVTLSHATAAGGTLPPVITSASGDDEDGHSPGYSILSFYEGEEELISRAANYGLSCTEEELAQKLYHIDKVDLMDSSQGKISASSGVFAEGNLLHRCAQVSVIEPGNARLHIENMETFQLLVQAFKLRVDADHMTERDVHFFFHECETKSGDTFMSLVSRPTANGSENYLLSEFYASWDDVRITGRR